MFYVKYPPEIEVTVIEKCYFLLKCDAAYCGEHFTDLFGGAIFFRLHGVRASHCYEALFNLDDFKISTGCVAFFPLFYSVFPYFPNFFQ